MANDYEANGTQIEQVEEVANEDIDEQAVIENVIQGGIVNPTGISNSVQVLGKGAGQSQDLGDSASKKQLILNPTINQQIRNRVNYKKQTDPAIQNWPVVKKFVPVNKHEAVRTLHNDNFILHQTGYDDHLVSKM